mmetsp:Transcript_6745/g.11312  ORF Transcript_6745/g.11312 Transcript_6745/m.11312 type:complete len:114 (-) Transcript_6745:67-408(-)
MVMNILVSVYLLGLAALLFLSMRANEKVLFYFGFLRGKISKALFLLFCSALVFPYAPDTDSIKLLLGLFLMVIAVLQLLKYFNKDENDTNDKEPMMNDSQDQHNNSLDGTNYV